MASVGRHGLRVHCTARVCIRLKGVIAAVAHMHTINTTHSLPRITQWQGRNGMSSRSKWSRIYGYCSAMHHARQLLLDAAVVVPVHLLAPVCANVSHALRTPKILKFDFNAVVRVICTHTHTHTQRWRCDAMPGRLDGYGREEVPEFAYEHIGIGTYLF